MNHPTLVFAALLLLIGPSSSMAASPQLFKCVDGGHTVYQQLPCPLTAQVESAASGARASANAQAASEPAAKFTARLKPAPSPASSAPATLR